MDAVYGFGDGVIGRIEVKILKKKILIVDDEKDMIEFIRDALEDEGYEVLVAYDGEEVFQQLEAKPDLILLDVMMPRLDGLEVCSAIRETVNCPIIFLSARHTETDRIRGLAVGGDDYLVKPFSIRELKARLEAHLRREQRATQMNERAILHYGNWTIDLKSHRFLFREHPISLTHREFEIIQLLALHPGQVFSREQIYENIWGFDGEGDSSTVTEHVKNIRAKLATLTDENVISTVWGVGYKWEKS